MTIVSDATGKETAVKSDKTLDAPRGNSIWTRHKGVFRITKRKKNEVMVHREMKEYAEITPSNMFVKLIPK